MLKHNLVEHLLDVDLAYLAGLMDGEGCISLTRCLGKYRLFIRIKMVDVGGIKFITEKFGGKVHSVKRNPPRRCCIEWFVGGRNDVFELLSLLYPFLKVKKEQARVGIAFTLAQKNDPLDFEVLENLRIKMARLNCRGC